MMRGQKILEKLGIGPSTASVAMIWFGGLAGQLPGASARNVSPLLQKRDGGTIFEIVVWKVVPRADGSVFEPILCRDPLL